MTRLYDVIVIGAGPAGLAAAHAAATHGATVCVVDDNPQEGGQIWRGGTAAQGDARARHLWQELQALREGLQALPAQAAQPMPRTQQAPHPQPTPHAPPAGGNVTFLQQARVLSAPAPGRLLVQMPAAAATLHYQRLIIATGARELLLPFPGWTLPGVTGAGGLQALAKGGYPVAGKRVVVAGSGPLLLAVAATLVERGAHVLAIVEQAGTPQLARFAAGLLATPSKIAQALRLWRILRGIPYHRNSYIRAASGNGALREVEMLKGTRTRRGGADGGGMEGAPGTHGADGTATVIACDYLACGYGLAPNAELAMALGCAIDPATQAVQVAPWQQTSVANVYCAGEGTGVGGVDKALAEGRIAGLAAAGRQDLASRHVGERARWQGFARRLARAFALRPAIAALADDTTIVCRCEDVCHGALRQHGSWRSAKLHTRCGMGPCQGRVCGGATAVLYGWRPDAVRVPLSPARIGSLIDS